MKPWITGGRPPARVRTHVTAVVCADAAAHPCAGLPKPPLNRPRLLVGGNWTTLPPARPEETPARASWSALQSP